MLNSQKIARALSDPLRYQILLLLARTSPSCCPAPFGADGAAGLCNCEIMARMNLIQSRVSYHMKELVEAGLVTEKPSGKWKYYFLNREVLQQFIRQLQQDFDLE
ncbi:MAG: ArsR/SmtB family transcription factor [Desulfurispora sp.]|uniref:ArsR/SmtB family transcription factor n=1 Tax=Desulfurispora sp. TaxID=3014275 RepID=UPI00404A3A79